jgi:peptidoglycan L-alanyl-D-glutamate endopeptidase CwlK
MASRSLAHLNPETRRRAEDFVAKCAGEGVDVLIYCTYRSPQEQDMLYAQGRTTAGPNPRASKPMGDIVTNARAGQSWHNYGAAFDFVPLVNGKAAWNDKNLYASCGKIAEALGLEWAGRWTGSLRETAHCQFRNGLTLAQVREKLKV